MCSIFSCKLFFVSLALIWPTSKAVDANVSSPAVHNKLWISQLFQSAQTAFNVHSVENEQCRRDYALYLQHLSNQSIWAVKMFESSEWPTVGILAGMRYHMGNWAECTSVSTYHFNGQYCFAEARYDFSPDQDDYTVQEIPAPQSSAWTALKMYLKNPNRVDRHFQTWAMCVPASCTYMDLQSALIETAQPVFERHGFNASFHVDEIRCSTRNVPTVKNYFEFVKILFGIFASLIIVGTSFDVFGNTKKIDEKSIEESVSRQFFNSFSIIRNVKALIHVKPSDQAPIHFAKFVGMVSITIGHLYIFTLGFPTFNTDYIELEFGKPNIVLSRSSLVDLFFAISGLLTIYHGLEPTKKGGFVFLIFSLIIRWLRMVPVFGIVMLFIIYYLPSMGNGPFWKERIFREVDYCSSSWWSNLLAMSNYIHPEKQCLVVGWYISVDIQMTIVACVLMLVIAKNRKIGALLVFLIFIGGQLITFAKVYSNNYNGLLLAVMSFLEEPRRNSEFIYFYIQPYVRFAPYAVGMATALTVFVLRERGYEFPKMRSRFILLILLVLSEVSQWYGVTFYQFGKTYNSLENALFAALYRWMFVLPYAFLGLLYLTSGFERALNVLLNRSIYVPLGRLTYSVYLTNNLVELYVAAIQGDLIPSSTPVNMYYWAIATVVYTYVAGFVLYLFIEAPFTNLTRLFQQYLVKKFVPQKTLGNNLSNEAAIKKNLPEDYRL